MVLLLLRSLSGLKTEEKEEQKMKGQFNRPLEWLSMQLDRCTKTMQEAFRPYQALLQSRLLLSQNVRLQGFHVYMYQLSDL